MQQFLVGSAVALALVFILLILSSRSNWGAIWLNAIDGLVRLHVRYFHRARIEAIPLPAQGPALVVANHVSGLDPLLLIAATRRPLRFIIAHEQYDLPLLKWVFRASGAIRVNREHHPEQAAWQALRALHRGEVVMLFPHGGIHLDSDPPKRLKRGAVKLSQWTGAPIYPCRIDGVKGESETLSALFKLGEPAMKVARPVTCDGASELSCSEYITQVIETPAQRGG